MKKNFFFWFTAAVTIAALVFTGCSSPGGETPITPTLTGITVTPPSRSIGIGQTASSPLVAAPVPTTETLGSITWSSEDTSKVTVNAAGIISGVAITTSPVKVYATSVAYPSIKGYCEVTVTEHGVTPTAISVTPTTKSLTIGQTSTLTATQEPTDAADTIEWTSEDTDTVTVNKDTGVITAVAITASPVKVYATSKENPTISGYCEVTVTEGPLELKLTFIPKPGSTATQPTLPTKDADNIYTFDKLLDGDNAVTGNWASASGFEDVILVYPDRMLTGNFKLRARVKVTDATVNSSSKGLIVGAFAGAEGIGDFATGGGGTVTTGINLRSNGALRNYQSRESEKLAATGLNVTSVSNKEEEFIYEVIRDENGIITNTYISKTGDILTSYSSSSPISYSTAGVYIQADTPVYAGIALAAIAAKISQIELWDGDLDGDPVFYSGDSTAAPVPVTGISITVAGSKGTLTTSGTNPGTSANPAQYYVTETAAEGSLELLAEIIPAYADIPGAQFWLSEDHTNDSSISVNQTSGVVTIGSGTGVRSATILALSNDPIEAGYYLTITVTPSYVPVDPFDIVSTSVEMLEGNTLDISTDINLALVTDPEIVWTTSDSTTIVFVENGNEVDTVTGPTARIKGLLAGTATITATATTTDGSTPTVEVATEEFTVKSTAGALLHWKFESLPTGWSENADTAATSTSPATTNVAVLYEGLNLRADLRNQRMVTVSTTSGYSAGGTSGFSDACWNPRGGSYAAATLGPVKGPFTITINYASGSADAAGRYPRVSFNTDGATTSGSNGTVTDPFIAVDDSASGGSTDVGVYKTYVYSFTGRDVDDDGVQDDVYVHFGCNNNLRFYDIKVQF